MTWYLPPTNFIPPAPINFPCPEAEINSVQVIKEGAKYIIPSAIVGILFKEASTRVSSLPIESFISSAQIACNLGYITMACIAALGMYKMAQNIEEQENPPPEKVTILKSDHDKLVKDNSDQVTENTRLLNELEMYKRENAQLRCIVHNTHYLT